MELSKPDQIDTKCPTSGEPCPAMTKMCELYVGNADQVEPQIATRDRVLFTARRVELAAQAVARSCEGPSSEVCPTRTAMDSSKVRKGFVSGLRTLFS